MAEPVGTFYISRDPLPLSPEDERNAKAEDMLRHLTAMERENIALQRAYTLAAARLRDSGLRIMRYRQEMQKEFQVEVA